MVEGGWGQWLQGSPAQGISPGTLGRQRALGRGTSGLISQRHWESVPASLAGFRSLKRLNLETEGLGQRRPPFPWRLGAQGAC